MFNLRRPVKIDISRRWFKIAETSDKQMSDSIKSSSKVQDGSLSNLEEIATAAEQAIRQNPGSAEELAICAANAMPVDASDLDRGMAAGFALARYLTMVRGGKEGSDL